MTKKESSEASPPAIRRTGVFADGCASCGKTIYNGLFCSVACADTLKQGKQAQGASDPAR